MNPLGNKRKVAHESGGGAEVDGFIPGAPSSSSSSSQGNSSHHNSPGGGLGGSGIASSLHCGPHNGGGMGSNIHHSGHGGHDPLSGHYADSYFKKKKKN